MIRTVTTSEKKIQRHEAKIHRTTRKKTLDYALFSYELYYTFMLMEVSIYIILMKKRNMTNHYCQFVSTNMPLLKLERIIET